MERLQLTRAEIQERFEKAQGNYNGGTFWNLSMDYGVTIAGASEWSFDEMLVIAKAFGTENINMEDAGCDTCGYGATISLGIDIRD